MRFVKLPRPVHICNCGDHAWVVLTQGYITMVSPEDANLLAERCWQAYVYKNKPIYAVMGKGTKRRLHRQIIQVESDDQIDHRNGNSLDNRRPNLRTASHQQNTHNNRGKRKSSSKFKGVSWYPNYGKWRARICINRNIIFLGYTETEYEAAKLYDAAAFKHFGSYARLNLHDH